MLFICGWGRGEVMRAVGQLVDSIVRRGGQISWPGSYHLWLQFSHYSTASLAVKAKFPTANLMEHRFFVSSIVFKSNIRHKRDSCRKQQILLLLLCCLNGSSKESPCWTTGPRRRRNVLEGDLMNVMDVVNIPRKFDEALIRLWWISFSGRSLSCPPWLSLGYPSLGHPTLGQLSG